MSTIKMTMAKADDKDQHALTQIMHALEALDDRRMPLALSLDEESEEWFDAEDGGQCQRALAYLVDIVANHPGALFRVSMAAHALLNPNNKLLDPDADHLAFHPRIAQTEARYQHLLRAEYTVYTDTCESSGAAAMGFDEWQEKYLRIIDRQIEEAKP